MSMETSETNFIHVYCHKRKKKKIHTDGHVEKKNKLSLVTERRGHLQGTIYYMNIETGERSHDLRTTHFHFELH